LITARIAIEEDAVFRGSIDIVKPGAKPADLPVKSENPAAAGEAGKARAAVRSNSPA
jgi:hypothetical protein